MPGVRRTPGGAIRRVAVKVKDAAGRLRGSAIPAVELADFNAWMTANPPGTHDPVVARIEAAIDRCLGESPLCGLIAEAPTGGHFDHLDEIVINRAALSGFVVVKVYRGTPRMFVGGSAGSLYLAGSNLNANKARVLLMACLLRFGCPRPAADPAHPTRAELAAVRAHLVQFQKVFDTH